MFHRLLLIVLLLVNTWLACQAQKIILDTDLDSDVDDVGAMAMLHTLADNGRTEILGIVVTSDDEYSPLCADAINHYFGRPDIPIGVEKGVELVQRSKYTREISMEFPHSLVSYNDAEDATTLYRRLLAHQSDSSVTIVTIGHLTNLMGLIESKPDQISPLSGLELIRIKTISWVCMGGRFPSGKEANFYRPDPISTQVCIEKWPGLVVFSGWEIGNEIITGGMFLKLSLSSQNPVWRAYQLYNNFQGRQSWDQTALLYAISNYEYWNIEKMGYCEVKEDGSNSWIKDTKNNNQGYLLEKEPSQEVAKIIDALMVGQFKAGF